MSKANTLLERLNDVKQTGPGKWLACCPAHDDRHASLAIKLADDDSILIHDFAGCAVEDILASIGLTFNDLFPDRTAREYDPTKPHSKPPRFSASELLKTALFEATILRVAIGQMLSGKPIDDADLVRVKLAITALDTINMEVGRGFR